jgi:hypothetical protein
MSSRFDKFKGSLSSKQQEILDKVLEEETRKKQKEILNSMERDQKHLELVNFCANFFVSGQPIPEKTGYYLTLVEPLYPLGVKNFDLGIFRLENSSLILVECKSSVSDYKKLMADLKKAIDTTNRMKKDLENILGNKIAAPIEFVLCLPAVDANEAYNETVKNNIPVCVWAASQFEGKLKHFNNRQNAQSEMLAGRLHRDGNLSSQLSRGVESKCRAIRPIAILPSSHMCTLLVYVSELIYMVTKVAKKTGDFMYSDIFTILKKELGRMTSLSDENLVELAEKMFEVALRKGIFQDLSEDVSELKRKIFQISGRKTSAEAIRKNVEDTYVDHNAKEKAKITAIESYRIKTKTPDITSFDSSTAT